MRTGDFNRDGRPDLLTMRPFAQATVMLGHGFGGFGPGVARRLSPQREHCRGRRRRRCYDDIVSVSGFTRVALLRSRGDGTFQRDELPLKTLPWGNMQKPLVADLDGDGFRDLVIVEDPWTTSASASRRCSSPTAVAACARRSPSARRGREPVPSAI